MRNPLVRPKQGSLKPLSNKGDNSPLFTWLLFFTPIIFMMGAVLFGCGADYDSNHRTKLPFKAEKIPGERSIESKYRKYFDEFINLGITFNVDLSDAKYLKSITTVDDLRTENVVGVCIDYFNERTGETVYREIQIRRKDYSDVCLRNLMFHELGHCILNLEHTEPNSGTIMQPSFSCVDEEILYNWPNKVRQLFGEEL